MMNFTGFSSIDHQSDPGTFLVLYKMMVNTAARDEGRKGDPVRANRPI